MKRICFYLLSGVILLFLLLFPAQAMESAFKGLFLCGKTVIPSLFPFLFLSHFLVHSGFLNLILKPFQLFFSRLFGISPFGANAFLLGIFSGYPIGAKTVVELEASGQITHREGNHLLRFCNNAGPLFIIGTVGVGMFGNKMYGYLLLLSHILSAVLLGLLFRKKCFCFYGDKKTHARFDASLISDSMNNALQSILSVCGYIVLFQVILCALEQFGILTFFSNLFTAGIGTNGGKGLLYGIAEVTAGVQYLSQLHQYPVRILLSLASAILGFGGFCVHAQTIGIIKKFDKKRYLQGKILQGISSAIITYLLYPVFITDQPVFYTHIPTQQELNGELLLTLFLLLITVSLYVIMLIADFLHFKKG